MREPTTVLKPTTYFLLTLFQDAGQNGHQFDTVWKTEKGAARKARALFGTGNYELIVMRREDVDRRDENCEISSSVPVNIWKKQGVKPPVVWTT